MADVVLMKQNDTAPLLKLTLKDDDVPVNLTGALVRVFGVRSGAIVFDTPGLVGDANGRVDRPWEAGDLSEKGDIKVEAEVTWPDNTTQTFPVVGTLVVRVLPDLDSQVV